MEEPVILKIFLIGFHHKLGPTINSEYPPEALENYDTEHLPALCLPDQSHNFKSDTVYFIVPFHSKKIFGVSCFRQIRTEELRNRSEDDEFSRSSVQKSVCCLLRLPMFGYIEVKLNIIVDKIFEAGNFDCQDLLKETYYELSRCLTLRTQKFPNDSQFISSTTQQEFANDYYIETYLRELITLWKHKILILFKLLLLEKRVIFYGSPVKPVCATIISIISLHPELLNKGLCDEPEQKCKIPVDEENQSFTPDKSPVSENPADLESVKQITILPTIPTSEYFAPLQVFKNGFLCLPFISLSCIDIINNKHNGFVVGASNVLFQQKKNLVDVLVDVKQMTVEASDPEIKKCLALTTEDLRFFEHVTRGIDNPRADGYGFDSWIREQFESYFTSMLKTAYENETDNDNLRKCECFNAEFISAWRKTNNFQDWLAKKITSTSSAAEPSAFDNFPSGHPFSRQSNVANVSDFRNKISQSINDTQSARKINQALSNAKTTFSSWLSNFHKEEISRNEDSVIRENSPEDKE